jgi:hypothetical protein
LCRQKGHEWLIPGLVRLRQQIYGPIICPYLLLPNLPPNSSRQSIVLELPLRGQVIVKSHKPAMADPFTIIGLVSSIITFIDFGVKAVSLSKVVRDSCHSTLPEVRELELIVNDIQTLATNVIGNKSSAQNSGKDDQGIVEMAKECCVLADNLRTALDKMKVREGTWSKTMDSFRVIFQFQLKKHGVDDLLGRLQALDARIRISVNQALQGSGLASHPHLVFLENCSGPKWWIS